MEDYVVLVGLGCAAVVAVIAGIAIQILSRKTKAAQAKLAAKEKARANKRVSSAKTVKKTRWQEVFAIDGDVIDNDHMTLFGQINNFNRNIPRFQTTYQMMPILMTLQKYTQTHFKREERLQQLSGYPFREDHKREHDALIETLDGLLKKAKKSNPDNVTDVAIEIGSFLQEWLTGHVVENDLPMKPFVDRMREHASGMGRLASQKPAPAPSRELRAH